LAYLDTYAASQIGAVDHESNGQKVTVYVNPNNPDKSYLTASPYPFLIEWLFPILPLIGIFYGFKIFLSAQTEKDGFTAEAVLKKLLSSNFKV